MAAKTKQSKKQNAKKQINKKQKTLLSFFAVKDATQSSQPSTTPSKIRPEPIEQTDNHPEKVVLDNSSSEETNVLVKTKRRKTKKRIIQSDDDDDNSDIDKVVKNKQRKTLKRRIIDSDDDAQEEFPMKQTAIPLSDTDDDLDFLDKSDILKERTRGKQVSRYSEALKKLKDRKSRLARYDKGEKGPIEDFAIESSEEEETEEETEGDTEEEEEDFVVDDDVIDGFKVTDHKTMMELPPEFSKNRVLSFKRQLKTYIQYLVELVLNPVFDPTSTTRYHLAKEAVTRRVQTYRDSMVTSDVWLPSFKEAVDRYSKWEEMKELFDHYAVEVKCEACRANKPASTKVALSDMNGQGDQRIFYLGSECYRKGEMYHHFKHFASHMFMKVQTIVDDIRIKNRGLQDPSAIYSKMRKEGYIKKLTKDVQKSLNMLIKVYNLRGHRARIEESSSSSSSSISSSSSSGDDIGSDSSSSEELE